MAFYLDADIFLALIKDDDRYKKSAQQFFYKNKDKQFVTSTLTCLEIWFYLHKNNLKDKALDGIRSVIAIAKVVDYGIEEIEAAVLLAEQHKLTPADAIHAVIAIGAEGIVSSDNSFDSVKELKRIHYLKTH